MKSDIVGSLWILSLNPIVQAPETNKLDWPFIANALAAHSHEIVEAIYLAFKSTLHIAMPMHRPADSQPHHHA